MHRRSGKRAAPTHPGPDASGRCPAAGETGPASEGDLRLIAERGAVLAERLGSPPSGGEGRGRAERFEAWSRFYSSAGPERFRRRLEAEGLTPEAALARLGGPVLSDGHALPAWVLSLNRALSGARGKLAAPPPPPVPFSDALAPLVSSVMEAARCRGGSGAVLAPAAVESLEAALFEVFSLAGGQALLAEFTLFRAARGALGFDGAGDPRSRKLYGAFASRVSGTGAVELFKEYGGLARLLGTLVSNLRERVREFLSRLRADLPLLGAAFGSGGKPGRVASINPFLSDPHLGWRTVWALGFEDGTRVIYKPRDMRLEAAWFRFLRWANERGLPPPLKELRVLVRGGYGWEEVAEGGPCPDGEASRRFFVRAGALLFLTSLFGGADFHAQNLVCCGEDPVLVDLETLFHPIPETAEAEGPWPLEQTGLLPSPFGGYPDMSGLGGVSGAPLPISMPGYREVNTDAMAWAPASPVTPPRGIGVAGAPSSASAERDASALEEGFREAALHLLRLRPELTGPGGPLASFAGLPCRYIHRASRIYQGLLLESLRPERLRDATIRSCGFDRLGATLAGGEGALPLWPLLAQERRALEDFDIPIFWVRTDGRSLEGPAGILVEDCLPLSPLDSALRRLRALDPERAAGLGARAGDLYLRERRRASAPAGAPDGSLGERAGRDGPPE